MINSTRNINGVIAEAATRLRELHARVHETFDKKPHSSTHHSACKAFHESYDALAFPGGLAPGLERLKQLDPSAMETAIQFLEADPWFFGSGYIKATIVRRLKHAPLSKQQQVRLAHLVLRSVTTGLRRESAEYARLAPVVNRSSLSRGIESLARSPNPEARRRAEHVLHVLRSQMSMRQGLEE